MEPPALAGAIVVKHFPTERRGKVAKHVAILPPARARAFHVLMLSNAHRSIATLPNQIEGFPSATIHQSAGLIRSAGGLDEATGSNTAIEEMQVNAANRTGKCQGSKTESSGVAAFAASATAPVHLAAIPVVNVDSLRKAQHHDVEASPKGGWPLEIVDAQGRRFRKLRLSLTAACNYACTYCVPNGRKLQAAADELSAKEMLGAVDLLMEAAGIEKLHITGGEPLVSRKFDELLPAFMKLPLKDVCITTNGQLLAQKADLIIGAGLRRINVSLDTLDAGAFRSIARGGDLDAVLLGIDRMLDAGIKVKINMVAMRLGNADQFLPMLNYCFERGIELRFIELMNMGHLRSGKQFEQEFLGMDEILELISRHHEPIRADAPRDSTTVRFQVPGNGFFGFCANESKPFCSTCTRLRLASNGFLYGCLSNARCHDMRPVLRLPRRQALARLRPLLILALANKQSLGFRGETTAMKFIGG